jgi:predicted butyrate kinase (DUF1464 family)
LRQSIIDHQSSFIDYSVPVMPRVIGIDPGTISLDICGIENQRVFLDRSLPTREALADPSIVLGVLDEAHRAAPVDLVAGPSGYGLPLTAVGDVSERDLRLAFLAARNPAGAGDGGIGGLTSLVRALARSSIPVVLTPGVIHLQSVPLHRKVNRVDMGTADKVCAAALAIWEFAHRHGCDVQEASFILLELGGAFTAAVGVDHGVIVDGLGGTSGPLGARAAGALDGEVAYLAGSISKHLLFGGGAATVAGTLEASAESLAAPTTAKGKLAYNAFIEGAVKAVAALSVSVPHAAEVILSGRFAYLDGVREELTRRFEGMGAVRSVHLLTGFSAVAKQASQGGALIADGLSGGESAVLVDRLGIRQASGTILDHLYVISPDAARRRLGID